MALLSTGALDCLETKAERWRQTLCRAFRMSINASAVSSCYLNYSQCTIAAEYNLCGHVASVSYIDLSHNQIPTSKKSYVKAKQERLACSCWQWGCNGSPSAVVSKLFSQLGLFL
jgi:hypothetical protein